MATLDEQTVKRAQTDHESTQSKSDKLSSVSASNWGYIFKRSFNKFLADGSTDLAAALTYFAVLSIFPALLAIVSTLGVFGQGDATANAILKFLGDFAPKDIMPLVEEPIRNLSSSSGAGLALIIGIVGALWTASGYVGAFGRAMNKIYRVTEGRPIWVLRPWNLLVTAGLVLLVVLMMLVLLLSGSALDFLNNIIPGVDLSGFTAVWLWVRWPVIFVIAVALIALLYYGTPNIKQPKFHWLSPGALIALITMGIAGVGFTFYVTNFGKYNATYGMIGGVIVLLLFLWIMNNVLLFGAQIDAEIERIRELRAGIRAEETLILEPRSDTMALKNIEKQDKLVEEARAIRLENNGVDFEQKAKDLEDSEK